MTRTSLMESFGVCFICVNELNNYFDCRSQIVVYRARLLVYENP